VGSQIEKEFYQCSAPTPYVLLDSDFPIGKTSLAQGQCQVSVASKMNSVSVCKTFTNGYLKEDCIRAVAIAKNDMHLCDQSGEGFMSRSEEKRQKIMTTTQEDAIDQCYSDFGLLTNQVAACEARPLAHYGAYEIAKNNCYGNIAIHTKNARLCEKIDYDFLQKKCLAEINTNND
jgi:hypothetical protein